MSVAYSLGRGAASRSQVAHRFVNSMSDDLVKPADLEKLLKFIEAVIPLPYFFKVGLAALVLAALLFLILATLLKAISVLQELWLEKIVPKILARDRRVIQRARRLFAQYLKREVEVLNMRESWRDELFADLEAEVEAEGGRRLLWLWTAKGGSIRREHSLTLALQRSSERLILVEGDPAIMHLTYRA